MALYQLPQPRGPIGGVTVQATHPVFKTNQPEIGRYENEVRQYVPRYVIGARVYIHQGATLQATHPVPPQGQPDQARYAVFSNASRFIVSANIYRHQGVTVQATHPVPPNFTRHEARRFLPDINDY